MKAAIRVKSLPLSGYGNTLNQMELHGKRLDNISKVRHVRDKEPLVYNSLDLRKEFDKHTNNANKHGSLKKPAMHALVQFPTNLPTNNYHEENRLNLAIAFVNEVYGGRAVFAARLDRDESGRHNVDVFFTPLYEKVTKRYGKTLTISTTKHGKELCKKHKDEIIRRSSKNKFSDSPRQVGIALQSELHIFLEQNGIIIEPRKPKTTSYPDRLEPESYKENLERRELEAENKALRVENQALVNQALEFSQLTHTIEDLQKEIIKIKNEYSAKLEQSQQENTKLLQKIWLFKQNTVEHKPQHKAGQKSKSVNSSELFKILSLKLTEDNSFSNRYKISEAVLYCALAIADELDFVFTPSKNTNWNHLAATLRDQVRNIEDIDPDFIKDAIQKIMASEEPRIVASELRTGKSYSL